MSDTADNRDDSSQVDEDATSLVDTSDDDTTEDVAEDTSKESDAHDNDADDATDSQEEDEDSTDDDDEILKPLKKLRSENKNLRDRLKAAEARVTELEATTGDEAIITERDELKAKLEQLTTKVRTERLERLVTSAATEAGAIEPDAVAKLINADDVTWNDDGEPTNVADLVTKAKTQYKRLFAVPGSGNVGNRNQRNADAVNLKGESRIANALNNRD